MTIIDKLRELEAKAMPGPWEYQPDQDIPGHREPDYIRVGNVHLRVDQELMQINVCDWHLIAAMRNALPALLRVAEAAVDWSNAEFGQDLNECAALRDAVDALSALEVES